MPIVRACWAGWTVGIDCGASSTRSEKFQITMPHCEMGFNEITQANGFGGLKEMYQ